MKKTVVSLLVTGLVTLALSAGAQGTSGEGQKCVHSGDCPAGLTCFDGIYGGECHQGGCCTQHGGLKDCAGQEHRLVCKDGFVTTCTYRKCP